MQYFFAVSAAIVALVGQATALSAEPQANVLLPQDTPVELMAMTEVNTDSAKPGSPIKLRVNKPIEIDGHVIVPVGTPAFGEVTTARDAASLGKSGRMTARLDHIQLGEAAIPLDGSLSAKGTNAGSAGVIALVTLNPLMLFHRGNNAKIKAGEIISAFVSQDVALDLSGPLAKRVEAAQPAADPAR